MKNFKFLKTVILICVFAVIFSAFCACNNDSGSLTEETLVGIWRSDVIAAEQIEFSEFSYYIISETSGTGPSGDYIIDGKYVVLGGTDKNDEDAFMILEYTSDGTLKYEGALATYEYVKESSKENPQINNINNSVDINDFPGVTAPDDIDDIDTGTFEPDDIDGMTEAVMIYCNYLYGNHDGYINRPVYAEYMGTEDVYGEECHRFDIYEIYDDEVNTFRKFDIPVGESNLDNMYFSDLGELVTRAEDEADDEILNLLMNRAYDHLYERYPDNEFSIGYSGQGCHKVYIDDCVYFELSVYDSRNEASLGYFVLSDESDTMYRRISNDGYIEYNP